MAIGVCMRCSSGEGKSSSPQRVYRVYKQEGLAVRRLKRKRLSRSAPLSPYLHRANQEWALDFASDALATGRGIRVLAIVDAFTRECLALEVDTGLSSQRVTRSLDQIVERRGVPQSIRCDNGPELTSRHFLGWCEERKIQLIHIQPGKPTQNPYASHCTSLKRCGRTEVAGRRSNSLMPCAFRGMSAPTGSYSCSGLSV